MFAYIRHATSVTLPVVTLLPSRFRPSRTGALKGSFAQHVCTALQAEDALSTTIKVRTIENKHGQITLQKHRLPPVAKKSVHAWVCAVRLLRVYIIYGAVLHSALSTTIKVRTIENEHEQTTLQRHRLPPIAKKVRVM